jgi:hypothetical protein
VPEKVKRLHKHSVACFVIATDSLAARLLQQAHHLDRLIRRDASRYDQVQFDICSSLLGE